MQVFGGTIHGESCIQRIDLVGREDMRTGEPFNIVFLHFKQEIPSSAELEAFIERIEAGEEIKIEYKYPWFWKVRKNNAKKHESNGPRMIFDDNEIAKLRHVQQEFTDFKNKISILQQEHDNNKRLICIPEAFNDDECGVYDDEEESTIEELADANTSGEN